jgi:hypothetical protein
MLHPKRPLWTTLIMASLGLLLIAPGLAQEAPDEPEAAPEEISEEPESPPEETPEAIGVPEEKAPALTVTATICTEIQDREPVEAGDTFPATVGKLYCHTLVEGCEDSTMVTHVWYYGEEKMAEVTLPVASPRWRTWSSKQILESWTGDWHVDILGEDGTALTSTSFQIQ